MEHTDAWWLFRSPKKTWSLYNYMALTAFTTPFPNDLESSSKHMKANTWSPIYPHFPPGAMTGIGSSNLKN